MTFPVNSASMLPAGSFSGKTIIITGGGTGLGKSMAKELLSLKARVVICGRREDVLRETADELQNATGSAVLARQCDVREPAQVDAMLDAAFDRFGSIDALVNNAAGNFICPTERLSYNAFNAVVDIVLRGTFNCTLALGKRWIAAERGGSMLNIVATYAWTGSGYVVPSAAAKAGVLGLTRSLAAEWGPYGIRLNAIAPGPFPTAGAWSRLFPPQIAKQVEPERTVPAGRFGDHQELANLAAYLLSDFSAYITGDCVTIDGGQWLRGAGQFNFLSEVTAAEWDELQAAMRRKKT